MEPDDSAPKLDTNHGFIKSIIKNQINRDEFHKFMEEKRQMTEKILTEAARQAADANTGNVKKRRPQPPGTQLYVPPHLRKTQNLDGPTTSLSCPSPQRNTFSTSIVDNVEEEKLREKARSRFKERFSEHPSMNFSPSSSQATTATTPAQPLFLLSLRSESGENVEVAVMSNDNAARLAKELSRKHGYTDEQCRKLRETLDFELEKRLIDATR